MSKTKKLKQFLVNIREVHTQGYAVEAEDAKAAKRVVEDGGGVLIEGAFEFSHTLDSDVWTVEDWTGKDFPKAK